MSDSRYLKHIAYKFILKESYYTFNFLKFIINKILIKNAYWYKILTPQVKELNFYYKCNYFFAIIINNLYIVFLYITNLGIY
jgi:hypothetical protein